MAGMCDCMASIVKCCQTRDAFRDKPDQLVVRSYITPVDVTAQTLGSVGY